MHIVKEETCSCCHELVCHCAPSQSWEDEATSGWGAFFSFALIAPFVVLISPFLLSVYGITWGLRICRLMPPP